MENNDLPKTVKETQALITELIEFAEKEKDRDRRRELFLLSIELKEHLIVLKSQENGTR